jgi:hypothetical protein
MHRYFEELELEPVEKIKDSDGKPSRVETSIDMQEVVEMPSVSLARSRRSRIRNGWTWLSSILVRAQLHGF